MVNADDLVHLLSGVVEYDTYYMALCVWHDDNNPSMLLSKDGGFVCLACGENGTNEHLHKKIRGGHFAGVDSPEDQYLGLKPNPPYNVEKLHAYILECEQSLHESRHLQEFWRARGLFDQARTFKLGVSLGAWGTIPMYDQVHDKPIRVSYRAFHPDLIANGVRYWNSPGPPILYSPSWELVRAQSKVAVCYGLIDALAVSALGYGSVTPSSGKDSLKPEWLRDLGAKEYYFIPDEGEEATAIKHITKLGPRASMIQLPYVEHDTSDPADYFSDGKVDKLREYLKGYMDE
jgi:DNA primase